MLTRMAAAAAPGDAAVRAGGAPESNLRWVRAAVPPPVPQVTRWDSDTARGPGGPGILQLAAGPLAVKEPVTWHGPGPGTGNVISVTE